MKKRIFSAITALALCLSMLPAAALAAESEKGAQKNAVVELPMEYIDLGDTLTSAGASGGIMLFSLDQATGKVALADGNHEKWIDRLDLTGADYAGTFYDALVEASDNDGTDDWLIDVTQGEPMSGAYGVLITTLTGTPSTASEEAMEEEISQKVSEVQAHIRAVFDAFDRDHPEVFWLDGKTSISYSTSYNPDTFVYTTTVRFLLQRTTTSGAFDVRDTDTYADAAAIKDAIKTRDTQVSTIMSGLTGDETDVEKITYFNEWLTKHNAYNSAVFAGNQDSAAKSAWECISALTGKTGTEGPVCEGYSRAFKVLCDQAGIPCVLVDGQAASQPGGSTGAHMWNYAQVEGAWYAVDVTWNDPTSSSGDKTAAESGFENANWLLVGSNTTINGQTFDASHQIANCASVDGVAFTNGPELSETAYKGKETPVCTAPTGLTAVYGQTLADVALLNPAGNTPGTWAWEDSSQSVGDAGTHTFDATFTPSDTDAYKTVTNIAVTVTVNPKEVGAPTIELSQNSYEYDGTAKEPAVTVKDGETVIPAGEYTVSYRDNTDVGTATVTITDKEGGNYTVSGTATFTISALSLENAVVTVSGTYTYNGQAQTPTVTVTLGDKTLALGADYTIHAANNVNAGTAGFTVTGAGNYSGTASGTFTIRQATLTPAIAGTTTKTYDGATAAPADLCITLSGIVGEDDVTAAAASYTYDSADAGDRTIIASGIALSGEKADNYTLSATTATVTGSIGQRAVTVTPTSGQSKIYGDADPAALTYTVTDGSLVNAADLSGQLSREKGEAVGTYAITQGTLAATNNYVLTFTGGVTFAIKAATIENAAIEVTSTHTYDGSAQTPTVTVTLGDKTLTLGTDYTVSAANNINAGTAGFTVTGAGNYSGTASGSFTIQPKAVVATVTAADKTYDGTTNAAVTATVSADQLVGGDSITITGLTGAFTDANAGTDKTVTVDSANAVVTGTGSANYSITYPATTASITKADGPAAPEVTGSYVQDGETFTYTVNAIDGAEYRMDGGVWQDGNVFTGIAPNSSHTFSARFKETQNYVAGTEGGTGTVTFPRLAGSGAVAMADWTYGGTPSEPVPTSATNGTDGVTYLYKAKDAEDSAYTAAKPTNAGSYTVKATFTETITYTAATATADFTIRQAVLTPAITGTTTKTYDGATAAPADLRITLSGVVGEDDVTAAAASYAYDSADAGDRTITASGIALSGEKADNYTLSATTAATSGKIEKSQPTVAFQENYPTGFTYGDTVSLPTADQITVTGAAYGDVTFAWDTEPVNAGSYTLTATIPETANTAKAETAVTVTIRPKEVSAPTIELSQNSYEYDGTAKEPAVTVKDGETVIPAGEYTVSYRDNTDVGTATVIITDKEGGNYTVSGTATFTISVRSLENAVVTVSGTYTYDGQEKTPAVTVTLNGTTVPAGEYAISYSNSNGGNGDHTSAGAVTVTVTANEGGSYSGTASGTFTIRQAVLTPGISGTTTKTYDGATDAPAGLRITLSGIVGNDDVTAAAASYAYDSADAGDRTITASGITLSGEKADNYMLSATTAATSGKIEKSQPTVAFQENYPTEFTYGDTVSLPTADQITVTGASYGDVTFAWDTEPVNAGTYTLTATIPETANTAKAEAAVTVTIRPKEVSAPTIELSQNSYEYDGTAKEPAVTVKDGETVIPAGEYTVSYRDNMDVGTATVTITDKEGGNYTVSGTATFTISALSLENAVVTVSGTYTYDGQAQTPTVTVTLNGTTLTLGADYTIHAANNVNAGTAGFTVTGAGNYSGTASGTFTIRQATLTPGISGTTTKTYDGTTAAPADLRITLSGIVGEDDVTAAAASYTYDSADAGDRTITASGITLSGEKADNYMLSATTAAVTGSIGQRAVTVTPNSGQSKIYGDADPAALTYTVTDGSLVNAADLSGQLSRETGEAVGTYAITQGTLAATNNYVLTFTGGVTFAIKAATIENAALEVTSTHTYDGTAQTPTVSVTLGSKTLTLGTDYTVSAADNINAGTAGFTVTGAGNYSGTASGTFTIQPKAVVATVTAADKTYDGSTDAAVTATVSAGQLVGGDSITITGLTGAFTDANAGTDKTVTVDSANAVVTGNELGNYTISYSAAAASITAKEITGAAVTLGDALTFNGSEQTQSVTGVTVESLNVTYAVTGNTATDAGSYTMTITGTGNFTGSVTQAWSVAKAAAPTVEAQERTHIRTTATTGNEIDLGALLPANRGATVYTVTSGGYTALEDVRVENGVLTYGTKAADSAATDTITVTAAMKNYEDAAITVTVKLVDKTLVTITGVTAQDGVYNASAQAGYTGTPRSAYTGAYTITYAGRNGTSYSGTAAPTGAGDYTVTIAVPDGDPTYVGSIALNFTIGKKQLTWEGALTASKPQGDTGEAVVYGTLTVGGVLNNELSFTAPAMKTSGFTATTPGEYQVEAVPAQGAWFTTTPANYLWPQGNPAVTATVNAVKQAPVLPPELVETGDDKYKVEVETGLSAVPAALEENEDLNTPAKIETALKTEVTQAGSAIAEENTAVYDVTLLVSADGGSTWSEATAAVFPPDGLTVTLPYPDGTDSSYSFVVVHMFTTADFGKTPGDTETPAVTNTADGIQFTVTGLSPISVGWTEPVSTPTPSPSPSTGGVSVNMYAITVEGAAHGTVTSDRTSACGGTTITLTVTPDAGYVLENLTVTGRNGQAIPVTGKGGGKYTFRMPGGTVTVTAAFAQLEAPVAGPENPFTDVKEGDYFYDAVLWAVGKEITTGTSVSAFSPDAVCTRAQAVTFLWRAAGSPAPKSSVNPFTDVAAGMYYYNAVLWAVEQGITNGTGATTFSPDADCTRAQIVTFLWRAQKSNGSKAANPFTDVAADAYYADAVLWAVENDITKGTGATTFSPDADCTRAQIVTFLYRCFNK